MGRKSEDLLLGVHRPTHEQIEFIQAALDPNIKIIFCDAVAGSGKTFISVSAALKLIQPDNSDINKPYKKLHYLFATPYEECLGYRPGDQFEKEKIYLQPLYNALETLNINPDQAIEESMSCNKIKQSCGKSKEIFPWISARSIHFLRGTNISQSIVIIDEAQNLNFNQLKTVLTRIHDDCVVIVIGHQGQIDIDKDSGFHGYLEHFRTQEYCKVCNLTKNFRGELSRYADSYNPRETIQVSGWDGKVIYGSYN